LEYIFLLPVFIWRYDKACSNYRFKCLMTHTTYSVGQLANKAGCGVETVHYYEKIGIMPEPPRTEGGHRMYGFPHVKRLNFIRRTRALGFSIEQIRELLKFIDEPGHFCGEIKGMAMLQAREVQKK